MAKRMAEFFIFALIIGQIITLTSMSSPEVSKRNMGQTAINKSPHSNDIYQGSYATPHMTEAAIEVAYNSSNQNPDPYKMAENIKDPGLMKKLAQKEAQRIVQTGDVQPLQNQIEKNKVLLNLLGYRF